MPDVIAVDVQHETAADFQTGTGINETLKRQIGQINILHRRARLDFDDVPGVFLHRIEDVHARIAAIKGKGCFKHRTPMLDGRL